MDSESCGPGGGCNSLTRGLGWLPRGKVSIAMAMQFANQGGKYPVIFVRRLPSACCDGREQMRGLEGRVMA